MLDLERTLSAKIKQKGQCLCDLVGQKSAVTEPEGEE